MTGNYYHGYILENIRILLVEGFSVAELRRFCQYRSNFRDVWNSITEATGKSAIADLLIDHAERNLLFEEILGWAEEEKPKRYKLHRPYREAPPPQITTPKDTTDKKGEPRPVDPIAWDMRYGLPNQKYLEFISRYILPQQTEGLLDPFEPDVPEDKLDSVYVSRSGVEGQVCRLGTGIIMGLKGSGKTTLFRRIPSLSTEPDALFVQLPLSEVLSSVLSPEMKRGEIGLLRAGVLIQHIFNSYWQNLLLSPDMRAEFLPQLRQELWWMESLRWFYHRYPPTKPEIREEFELMTWLDAPSSGGLFGGGITPEDELCETVRLVTSIDPQRMRFGAYVAPYDTVQVLVDDTDDLDEPAIIRLVRDARRLHGLFEERIQFRLFVDSSRRKLVEEIDCVKRGDVGLYLLPEWNEQELHELMFNRLSAYNKGEFTSYDRKKPPQIGKTIPGLKPDARRSFDSSIVKGAMRAYRQKETDSDAVTHLLRLARGVFAACAGVWSDRYRPPLGDKQVNELVDIYWGSE